MVQQKRKRAGGKNKQFQGISNTDKKELVEFNFEGDDLVSDNEKSQGEDDIPKLTPEEEQGTLGLIDGDQGSDDSDSDDDAESETESKAGATASQVEKGKEGTQSHPGHCGHRRYSCSCHRCQRSGKNSLLPISQYRVCTGFRNVVPLYRHQG